MRTPPRSKIMVSICLDMLVNCLKKFSRKYTVSKVTMEGPLFFNDQNDFPDMATGFHELVSFRSLREVKRLKNDGSEFPCLDQRPDVFVHGRGQRGFESGTS